VSRKFDPALELLDQLYAYRDFRFQDKAAFASIEGHGGLLLMVKELA
jgi:hypothetical protein